MPVNGSSVQASQSSVYHSGQSHLQYLLKVPGSYPRPDELGSLGWAEHLHFTNSELNLCLILTSYSTIFLAQTTHVSSGLEKPFLVISYLCSLFSGRGQSYLAELKAGNRLICSNPSKGFVFKSSPSSLCIIWPLLLAKLYHLLLFPLFSLHQPHWPYWS